MGKLVSEIRVKWEGDLFQLFKFPYQFSQLIPHLVQNVDLLSGTWGTVGSVMWSLEYEKQNEGVPDPTAFLDYLLDCSKDMERSRHLVPN